MPQRKTRPTPEQLAVRNDVHEAREAQSAATGELEALRAAKPFLAKLTAPIIDRQGKNHYIETLYQHYPRSA